MQISLIRWVICLAFAQPVHVYVTNPADFKLVKRNEVISLYERWITSTKGEQVRELKAVFTVGSGIDEITRLLTNAQQGTRWNVNAKTYLVLPLHKERNWVVYIRYALPWPFQDQDCCLLYSINTGTATKQHAEIQFQSAQHERFPVQDKITRMNGTSGKWIIEERKNGTSQITYLISTDRSAKVPRWISDPIIHNTLFETMTAFKNTLEKNDIQ